MQRIEKLSRARLHHAWIVTLAQGANLAEFILQAKPEQHPDFLHISLEKTAIGVDQIRDINHFIFTAQHYNAGKVVLIDNAEKMTLAASNALLKNLEEPPAEIYFILATDRPLQLLPTIISRCSKMDACPRGHDGEDARLQQELESFFNKDYCLNNFDKLAVYNKKTDMMQKILLTLSVILRNAVGCDVERNKLFVLHNYLLEECKFLMQNTVNPQVFLESFFIMLHDYA